MVHEEQGGCTERRGIVIQYCTSNKGAGCMAYAGANCSGASVDKKGLRTGCHRKARQREGGEIGSQNTHRVPRVVDVVRQKDRGEGERRRKLEFGRKWA